MKHVCGEKEATRAERAAWWEPFLRSAGSRVLVAGEGSLLAPKPPEKACCLAASGFARVLTRVPHFKHVFTEVGEGVTILG